MRRQIRLLSDPAISDAAGNEQPLRGQQAWALLARLVLARAPIDRRTLAFELFPEADDPLGALRWCLAALRKALDCATCLTGDPVAINFPGDIDVDVWRLQKEDFDIEQAGPLLNGIEPRSSPEFATWLLVERERVAGIIDAKFRQETIRALAIADHDRAIRLAELGVRRRPLEEGNHVLLVKSLADSGRHEAALAHVEATERVFLAELGEKPSLALRSAARRSVSSPPGGIAPEAFVTSLMQSGLAALAAGAADAGIDCLRRAVGDADRIADKHLLARATLELGTALVHAVRGYDDEGAVLLRQSAELAERAGDATIAASGYRELGYVEALAGRRPAADSYLVQAAKLAEEPDNLAGIHAVMGFNLVDWGRIDDGLAQYETSLDLARSARNRRREIWSLGIGAWGQLAAGRLAEAESWIAQCLTLIDEQRWIAFRPWPIALQCECLMRRNVAAPALRPRLEEAFALSCQLGDPCWEAAVARALALTYAAENQLSEAMHWLGEARGRCFRTGDGYVALQVKILADQAAISCKQGEAVQTDAIAREWVAMAARTHMDAQVAEAAAFMARHTTRISSSA